jgi:hypothetical protein
MFLWEQFSSQMVHHPTSPVTFLLSWTGSFLIIGVEEGACAFLNPPHSRDLTALNYFSEGFLKDVYHKKAQNVNKLRNKIGRASERITNEISSSTRPEIEYRLDVCHATHVAHTEIY